MNWFVSINKKEIKLVDKEINFMLGYLIGTESHLKRNGKLTANDKIQINNYRVLLDNLIEQFEYEYGRKTKLSRTLESLKKRYDKIEKILIK